MVSQTAHASTALEHLTERLQGNLQADGSLMACCPHHDDSNPSVHVTEGEGCALVYCHAGCATQDVMASLELPMDALYDRWWRTPAGRRADSAHRGGEGGVIPRAQTRKHANARSGASAQPVQTGGSATADDHPAGCTLAQYAEAKKLPIERLRELGVSDMPYHPTTKAPAVRIPYLDEHGQETRTTRFRTALQKGSGVDVRFLWCKGSKPMLYGLWRLSEAREKGYVVLVEGESDCHTLWFHGYHAVGLPGANSWKPEWADRLEGIGTIYVVDEGDAGSEAIRTWLAGPAGERIRDRVRLVDLRTRYGVKDPSDLHLHDQSPDRFREEFQTALNAATTWVNEAEAERQARQQEAWERCASLAQAPDILDRVMETLAALGVAGEERAAKLLYLSFTSRLLDRIVSAIVKGPSSVGKSFVVEQVLRLFPPGAADVYTSMSEKALIYDDRPLSHRFVVICEAAGMRSDFLAYVVRSLMSEGQLRYPTVEEGPDKKMHTRWIEREGPTGVILTTTAVQIQHDNETRAFTIPVSDSPDQTARVMLAAAVAAEAGDASRPPDLEVLHAFQVWLEGGEHRVVIPYAQALSRAIRPQAVRLRRDFPALLSLIKAHALLHQATRERDARGQIIATFDDYAAVYTLTEDVIGEGTGVAVSPQVRETVAAVEALTPRDKRGRVKIDFGGVTVTAVATWLHLDNSSASRRVKAAITSGYLVNKESRPRQPARLFAGDPLPTDRGVLPTPDALREQLHDCTNANGHAMAYADATPDSEGGRLHVCSPNEEHADLPPPVPPQCRPIAHQLNAASTPPVRGCEAPKGRTGLADRMIDQLRSKGYRAVQTPNGVRLRGPNGEPLPKHIKEILLPRPDVRRAVREAFRLDPAHGRDAEAAAEHAAGGVDAAT